MSVIAVIPARYASSRFPGKPLALIAKKPMIQHVYERVKRVSGVERVFVATDSEAIAAAVQGFGGDVELTAADLPSGTDRVAEVARRHKASYLLNVQGDEPLINPKDLETLVRIVTADPRADIGTLCAPLPQGGDVENPNVVKVVLDAQQHALYFSRAAIPFRRDPGGVRSAEPTYLRHIGVYLYRADALARLAQAPPSDLERVEQLEQLRALQMGLKIRVVQVERASPDVNTPADLAQVEAMLAGAAHESE